MRKFRNLNEVFLQKWQRIQFLRNQVQPTVRTIHVTSRIIRSVSWLITYSLNSLKMSPDAVSLVSITMGITATYFALHGNFQLFICFYLLWALFDCCDGELARLHSAMSKRPVPAGALIEKINSDLQYLTWIPALAAGIFGLYSKPINWVFLAMIAMAAYNSLRVIFNRTDVPVAFRGKRLFEFYWSQCKGGHLIRNNNKLYKYTYITWRNLLTQFGIFPLAFLVLVLFSNERFISFFIQSYIVVYLIFSTLTITAVVLIRKKFADLLQ